MGPLFRHKKDNRTYRSFYAVRRRIVTVVVLIVTAETLAAYT